MQNNYRKLFFILLSLGLFCVVFSAGAYFGVKNRSEIEKVTSIANKEPKQVVTDADFEPFWKAWNLINEKYPQSTGVSDQERVWGAISGMVASLNDPYTTFFPPEENKSFNEQISGEFGGVGMEVGIKDKVLTVIAPLKGTPAYNAGIKSGDKILKINDTTTSDLTIDKAINLIRGEKGTVVNLTIFREGEKDTRKIAVTRDIISSPTINTEKRADGVFVIRLYTFNANSSELFRGALREFVESGSSKLVLDLRGNPGGYLESAIDMASWFLPIGKPVVLEDFGSKTEQKVYRSKGYDIFTDNLKFVILVDGGSASASEILSGALQEHKKAILVGEKTYGKGSVQELVGLTSNTSIKITIATWLTPNGVSISKQGLTPDVVVPFTREDFEKARDPQMDKAVELLLKK